MDTSTVIVSLAGAVVAVVGIVALLVKSFVLDKPKTNGNGNGKNKQLDDIEERLEKAVAGFRESHIEEKMLLGVLSDDLKELKNMVGICADILKKI